MTAILTSTLFTPAQAEKITGLSVASQRDFRRRGFMKATPGTGHSRFDVFDLAWMLFVRSMSDRGIGPSQSVEVAEWAVQRIVWSALSWINAFEGDHEIAFLEDVRDVPNDVLWGRIGDRLMRQFFRENNKVRVLPAPIFIWWADGAHDFHVSLDLAIDQLSGSDPKLLGPIVVMCLESVGNDLLDRAACAFVHVESIPAT